MLNQSASGINLLANSPSLLMPVKILLSFNSSLICRLQLLCIIKSTSCERAARRGWNGNKGKSLMTIIDFEIKFHFIALLLLLHAINTDIKRDIIKPKRTKIYFFVKHMSSPFQSIHLTEHPLWKGLFCGYMQSLIVVLLSKLICLYEKGIKKIFVQ